MMRPGSRRPPIGRGRRCPSASQHTGHDKSSSQTSTRSHGSRRKPVDGKPGANTGSLTSL
jgi:hypothetical protein